jgi:hypothetical protein
MARIEPDDFGEVSPMVRNRLFNTQPAIIHAQGSLSHIRHWQPIKEAFFAQTPQRGAAPAGLRVFTWNNGHGAMGMFERSLAHQSLSCSVLGAGIEPWINALHKPALSAAFLKGVSEEYVLGVDSRDAILIGDLERLLATFVQHFEAELVFSADRLNWPNVKEFYRVEKALAADRPGDFHFLNSGAFIGRTSFCRDFFAHAARTPPHPALPSADQGVFKQLFPMYHPRVQLDYECRLFQNIGLVFDDILEIA